jgi:hypothetical protein
MCHAPDGPVPAEPTEADIERDHPHWHTWVGVDRLCHGLRTQGAALTARGEDWQDLLDQIRRAEERLADTRPRGWPGRAPDPGTPRTWSAGI